MAEAKVKARMDLNGKPFERGVESAEARVKKMRKGMGDLKKAILGAFAVGAIAKFARATAQYGSMVSDIASQAGISTDAMQAFEVAAINAGAQINQVRNAFAYLRDSQAKALTGDIAMIDAFNRLGISIDHVANMNMQDLFEAVARAAKETGDFSAIVELLGKRNAPRLEEALTKLADQGFQRMIDSAREAGQILDEDMIQSLDRAEDAIQRLQRSLYIFTGNAVKNFEDIGVAFRDFSVGLVAATTETENAPKKQGLLNRVNEVLPHSRVRAAFRGGRAVQEARTFAGTAAGEREREYAARKEKERADKEYRDRLARERILEQSEREQRSKASAKIETDYDRAADALLKKVEGVQEKELSGLERGVAKAKSDVERERENLGKDIDVSSLRRIGAAALGTGRINDPAVKQLAVAQRQLKVQEDMLKEFREDNPLVGVF